MAVLELKNVSFKYQLGKEKVLENINLAIEKGEFVAMVGRNGAGKTTLCSIMRGIIPHFQSGTLEGEVLLYGKNVSEMNLGDIAQHVGFVFQNPFIQVSGVKKTVFEEIAFGLENLGVPRSEIFRRVEEVIQQLKIDYLRDKHPMQLSGGQSQRVALASVLVMDPEILIIDEPTSQLDPIGTEEVFETIKLLKERNKTIILVEHKIDYIAEYADRVLVVNEKSIVKDGKTQEVFSDEIIMNHGTNLPQVAQLAMALAAEDKMIFDRVPTTLDEAVRLFNESKGGNH